MPDWASCAYEKLGKEAAIAATPKSAINSNARWRPANSLFILLFIIIIPLVILITEATITDYSQDVNHIGLTNTRFWIASI
jgi:hypothetical protein